MHAENSFVERSFEVIATVSSLLTEPSLRNPWNISEMSMIDTVFSGS
jgi:hypothetical protein